MQCSQIRFFLKKEKAVPCSEKKKDPASLVCVSCVHAAVKSELDESNLQGVSKGSNGDGSREVDNSDSRRSFTVKSLSYLHSVLLPTERSPECLALCLSNHHAVA